MRPGDGGDTEVEVVVAEVKLSRHRRLAKPGKQPRCEYEAEEAEEAGRCRPCGFARRFPRSSGGVAVVSPQVGELGRRRPVSERIGALWETSSSDHNQGVLAGRCARSC
jgi:hypothetical protein